MSRHPQGAALPSPAGSPAGSPLPQASGSHKPMGSAEGMAASHLLSRLLGGDFSLIIPVFTKEQGDLVSPCP